MTMTKELSVKYNDSGIKMFQLLSLLYQGEADFKDVLHIFMDDKVSPNNANVNLCKYLNSLKVFGIHVEKNKDKYRAFNLPYTYNFTREELEAIQKFKSCAKLILSERALKSFDKFISALEIRYDSETQQIATELATDDEFDFSFYFKKLKEKFDEFEKYIEENQILEVTYTENGKDEIKVTGKPLDLIFEKRKALIKLYNNRDSQLYDIPLDSIRSVVQSPQKSGMPAMNTTSIVFKLRGRLAQNYKLRPNEYSKGTDSRGNLIVVNTNEDVSTLLHRLMRYGINCTVCTPVAIKEQMKELLDKTIANYS